MAKIKLLELDITQITEDFTPYSAGIYQRTMSVPDSVQANSFMVTVFGCTWDSVDSEPVEVGSVRVDNELLGKVDSIAEMYLQDGSFFYDSAAQILYIALFEYLPAWFFKIYKIGETTGFISEAQKQLINGEVFRVDAYLGATFYEPRLNNDITITQTVDDQQNSLFTFDNITASINNGDGKYDKIRDNITGNEARVLIANISDTPEGEIATGFPYKLKADREDFEIERLGIIEDVDYSDPNNPTIRAIDRRSDWSQTISTSILTKTDFPDLPDESVNLRKPLVIGNVRGVSCIRVEPEPVSSTNTDFIVHDTTAGTASLSSVYFTGSISGSEVDRVLTGGEYSFNSTTGVLTINNYDSGEAWAYGTFGSITNFVDIILFLLEEYAGLAYIPSNFLKNDIEIIRALGYQAYVYVDGSGEELRTVVEKLCMDSLIDFLPIGSTLTMKQSNTEEASIEDIPYYQITDNPAPWVNDRTDTVKTVTVQYNYDYRTDTYETYYDASREQEAIDNNRKAVDKVFTVNLTSLLDIESIYTDFYDRYVEPTRVVTINRTIPFTAGITDFVTFKLTRQTTAGQNEVFTRALYKVISQDKINNTAELVYFSDRAEPYFSFGRIAGVGGGIAYKAPDQKLITEPFTGNIAYTKTPAYVRIASITGISGRPASPDQSGNIAGINQQVGE